jgi:hypothetical protein
LGTFEKQAGPDLDELEVRLRHVGAVKDRVTHLEEQAERHGPPHSHGFAQKLQKARQEFARVARSGIETEIASLNAKIQSLVVALNEQIAGARQKLHALGVEQRDENERTAPPRPEPLKQSKAQVKEIWRFNPCSQWPERTEIPVEESTTGVSKNPKGWREALVDPDPYVRVEAIKAAGKSGKPDLVPDLIQALYREANEEMICRLVLALGEIGDPAAVPALLNQARHPDAYVRIAVAWALGQMGDPRGIPALQELARDHSRPTCCIKNGMRPACERKISEEARDALAKIRKP